MFVFFNILAKSMIFNAPRKLENSNYFNRSMMRIRECSQRIAECSLRTLLEEMTNMSGRGETFARSREVCKFLISTDAQIQLGCVDEAEQSRVMWPMELKMQLSLQFLHFTPTFYCNLISLNVELLFKCLIFSNLAERAERQK